MHRSCQAREHEGGCASCTVGPPRAQHYSETSKIFMHLEAQCSHGPINPGQTQDRGSFQNEKQKGHLTAVQCKFQLADESENDLQVLKVVMSCGVLR